MPSTKRSSSTEYSHKDSKKKVKLDYVNLKPSQTLYVKNLNTKINKKILLHNLYLLFSAFGDIISINLQNGFAFIIFSNLNLATLALRNLKNQDFFDKPLVLNYAVKESKAISQEKQKLQDDNDEEVMPLYE